MKPVDAYIRVRGRDLESILVELELARITVFLEGG